MLCPPQTLCNQMMQHAFYPLRPSMTKKHFKIKVIIVRRNIFLNRA